MSDNVFLEDALEKWHSAGAELAQARQQIEELKRERDELRFRIGLGISPPAEQRLTWAERARNAEQQLAAGEAALKQIIPICQEQGNRTGSGVWARVEILAKQTHRRPSRLCAKAAAGTETGTVHRGRAIQCKQLGFGLEYMRKGNPRQPRQSSERKAVSYTNRSYYHSYGKRSYIPKRRRNGEAH